MTDDSLLIMVSDDGLGMEEKLDELNSDCDMEDEDKSSDGNGVALKKY